MTSNIYLNQSTTVEQYFKTIKIVNSNLLLYVVADLQQTQQSQHRRREKMKTIKMFINIQNSSTARCPFFQVF